LSSTHLRRSAGALRHDPDIREVAVTAVQANGITIEYETLGSPDDDAMLLVMGHGAQLVSWPPSFVRALADAGFHVITYDNRDVGLSTTFPAGTTYTIGDMAADGMGLLDALGIERAHVAGASMGGGIVQQMAIDHPERVLSLCSIMSTTSGPGLPPPPPEKVAAMLPLLMNPPTGRDEVIEHAVKAAHVIGSTAFPIDEAQVRERAAASYDRGHHPAGRDNQSAAVAAAGDRTEALGKVTVPTVVVHGSVDPLVPPAGGELTANAVPGAELVVVEGMGHDLPEGAVPIVVEAIVTNARRATAPG
jgi:pimeloyl-ACP methyl ester carboxylesterase